MRTINTNITNNVITTVINTVCINCKSGSKVLT